MIESELTHTTRAFNGGLVVEVSDGYKSLDVILGEPHTDEDIQRAIGFLTLNLTATRKAVADVGEI